MTQTLRAAPDFAKIKGFFDPIFRHCPQGGRIPIYVVAGNEVVAAHYPKNAFEAAKAADRYSWQSLIVDTCSVPDDAPECEAMGWNIQETPYGLAIRIAPRWESVHPGTVEAGSLWVSESVGHVFPEARVSRFRVGCDFFVLALCRDIALYDPATRAVVLSRIERLSVNAIAAASKETAISLYVMRSPGFPVPRSEVDHDEESQ